MSEITKQVESILHRYSTMKRELQVLEYEFNRISPALTPEEIESRIFSHPGYEKISSSHLSDQTSNIVVEHIDRQRNSEYHALVTLTHNIRAELDRLEYYLTMLPEDEANIIKMFYFDSMLWTDILERSSCSLSTLKRRKRSGLNKLVYYYSIADGLEPVKLGIQAKIRFISYLHEERFISCLNLAQGYRNPGKDAMLYILSGCNELWQAGVDTFFNFETGTTIERAESHSLLSENGKNLLRLAFHLANGSEEKDITHILRYYFAGLEYVHLELAIEALKLTFFQFDVK